MNALLHDTFRGRVRLEGLLTTRTGLHVGAGGSGDPLGTDAPVVRNAIGEPFIPGASLKGVLRSAAEALLHGHEAARGAAGRSDRLWACRLVGGGPACVDHERLKALRQAAEEKAAGERRAWDAERERLRQAVLAVDRRYRAPQVDTRAIAETVWEESCTVCRLFGSMALAGRVRFPDLPLAGPAPPAELRNGVGIDRDRELAADKILYDFEAVPPGTAFRLKILVDNPTDAEVGLLLYLFEELDRGHLALGGKSTRGLGLVSVEWREAHEIELKKDNPFADLLSTRNLLEAPQAAAAEGPVPAAEPAAAAAAEPAEEPGERIPEGGDPEVWRRLLSVIREVGPKIDKDKLGPKASAAGLGRDTLPSRLGLGEPGQKIRQVWDVVLERLAAAGALDKVDGSFHLPGTAPTARPAAPAVQAAAASQAGLDVATPTGRPPALQTLYDRYLGAIGRLWEEAR